MVNKQHYDVLIATPGSSLHNSYVMSLTKTILELERRRLTWRWLNGASSLVHHAREVCMSGDGTMHPDDRGPLHDQCTYNKIFWIDSDIEWTPEQFIKLYESPLEIVTGNYLLADGFSTAVHPFNRPSFLTREECKQLKELTHVQSCGFGFICIKSGVFERLERPWFGHLNQWIQNSRGEKLADSLGEDISWCVRAYNAKIPIHFDPSVLVNHQKTVSMKW